MRELFTTLRNGLLVVVLAGRAFSVTFRPEVNERMLGDFNDARALLGVDNHTAALIVGTRCLGTFVCSGDCDHSLGIQSSEVAELYDISEGSPRLLDVIAWSPIG